MSSVSEVPAILSTLILLSVALIVAWTAARRLERAEPSVVQSTSIRRAATHQGLDEATDRLRDAVDQRRPR